MNNTVFQGMTPYGLVEICQGVGETYCLHFPSFFWVFQAPNDLLAVLCPFLVTLYSPVKFNLLFPHVFLGALAGSLLCPTVSHLIPRRNVSFSVVSEPYHLFQCSSIFTYTSPTLPLAALARSLPV